MANIFKIIIKMIPKTVIEILIEAFIQYLMLARRFILLYDADKFREIYTS